MPDRDEFQDFRYTFENVISPHTFEVTGGDSRVRDLRIRVVDAPAIEMSLHVQYPAYLHRTDNEQPVTGIMQVPEGSRVTIKAHANKDLEKVEVDYPTPVKKGRADAREKVRHACTYSATSRRHAAQFRVSHR